MELHLVKLISLISFLVLSLNNTEAANNGNETQTLALLDFRSQFTDYSIDTFSSWNDSVHFCQWRGVRCSNNRRDVIGLNLRGMNLYGNVSPFIANLSFLESIDLSHNFLTGSVPHELGRLTNLLNLNLSSNQLSDVIPVSLSNCSKLISISLDHNYLTQQIPAELGSLSFLERLYLTNNNLTGNFPTCLGNLSSVREIGLSFNSFSGEIPETIGNLNNLTYLDLAINHFSGIFPPVIYNLSKLLHLYITANQFHGNLRSDIGVLLPRIQYLWFSSNNFTGQIPSSLSNTTSLVEIDLSSNHFTGNVPQSIGNLQNLTYLLLEENSLGNHTHNDLLFLTSLANCSNLEVLEFAINNFGGTLTSSIGNLSSTLRRLTMFSNSIGGTIPEDIASLTGLTALYLGNNLFTGNIPPSIGTLRNLRELDFYDNNLTGEIPQSLGNLSQLQQLYMYNTSIHGNIPPSFANLKLLQIARFGYNKLNGTIPPHFINSTSLTLTLNLSHNSFTGPLPNEVGNLEFLTILDVSHNNLSGYIPNNLRLCMSLNRLYMQNNSFQGNIPDLSQLRGLQYLDLSENNLTGPIPHYLANFSSLMKLNFSFNNFEGEVPTDGIFANASAIQVHGNSRLCGGIPQLSLKPCAKRQRRHVNLAMIIPITVIPSCVFIFFFVFYLHRKILSKRKQSSESSFESVYPKITFKELYDATQGFSPSNCIGAGSFGTVYLGVIRQEELPVAVKVLNLQKRGATKSFFAECEALKNIRHRNLVKIISVCSSIDNEGNDFKAFIYPYMENGSLEKWLHSENEQNLGRTLSITQRVNIAIEIASALEYLHHQCETPVIHCDLKPSNVLLDSDLTARVSDFGLASVVTKLSGTQSDLSQFSSLGIKGTIGYTAPEYGMGSSISTQGDVYSFGVLLLELFTGRSPVDQTFNDNLNLHNSVKMEFVDVVHEIIEQSTQLDEILRWACESESKKQVILDCVASVLRIGVECSSENPQDRMNMNHVVQRLVSVKEMFLKVLDENVVDATNIY